MAFKNLVFPSTIPISWLTRLHTGPKELESSLRKASFQPLRQHSRAVASSLSLRQWIIPRTSVFLSMNWLLFPNLIFSHSSKIHGVVSTSFRDAETKALPVVSENC